jgi:hypothetical protein
MVKPQALAIKADLKVGSVIHAGGGKRKGGLWRNDQRKGKSPWGRNLLGEGEIALGEKGWLIEWIGWRQIHIHIKHSGWRSTAAMRRWGPSQHTPFPSLPIQH